MDTHGDDRADLRQLLAEWADPPAEMVDTIPKGGVELKYLGHAATTRALLECDPAWWWEPMSMDDYGQPLLVTDDQNRPVGMWIYLHVCGVRRPGYGSCLPGKGDAIKELIGDAIRNASMRYGVALSLWSRDHVDKATPTPRKAKATPLPTPVPEAHHEKEAGKGAYEALVADHGKDLVNGAMAVYGVARFSELTPSKVQDITASLAQRAMAVEANAKAKAAELDPPAL